MSTIDWSYIDKVVYINLKRRSDRNYRIKKQLQCVGVEPEKIVRFEAIEAQPGYIGCTQSHIAVLEMAIKAQWRNVLILEDDIAFVQDSDAVARTNKFLTALGRVPWTVAFLAANYAAFTPFKHIDYIVRANKAWCACAYLVNSTYFSALLDNYKQGLAFLQQTNLQHKFALDVYWQSLMERDCWLGVYPNIGYQTPDRSDIENKFVDYKRLFFK